MEIIKLSNITVKCPCCFSSLKVTSKDIKIRNAINSSCKCPVCGREIFLIVSNVQTKNVIKQEYND